MCNMMKLEMYRFGHNHKLNVLLLKVSMYYKKITNLRHTHNIDKHTSGLKLQINQSSILVLKIKTRNKKQQIIETHKHSSIKSLTKKKP